MMEKVSIKAAGDSSILIEFGTTIAPEINGRITAIVGMIKGQQIEGIVDMIPSFCALLINYDPRVITYGQISERMEKLVNLEIEGEESVVTIYEIPVCYGGEYGPDLEHIATHAGLSTDEVIQIHSGSDYLIYMLGFMPGFPYLGGLDDRIHTPRLENPRMKIPAGSVGIGGAQTGIYPMESPGGWQLLGRTPVQTYNPNREVPILFESGDYIRFIPIGEDEYVRILEQVQAGTYSYISHRKEV